jgi:hypothetical protein
MGLLCLHLQATEEISAFICPALVDEHGHAVLRLSMGRLLDILLANMETAAAAAGQAGSSSSSSSSHAKLMMFSGHDSTIMPLLTGGAHGAVCATQPDCFSKIFSSPYVLFNKILSYS